MTLYPEDVERYGQPTDEPTEADPYPDGLPEDLYVDIESTIHQHCGHDGQSDEANDWVTDLMSAISPLIVRALVGGRPAHIAEVDGPWRASSSATATIVAGGRHPITDEMYPFALFHQGQPADLYMAAVIARLLNTAVGGRSAERCVVVPETGSVLHRYACDFGPDCPAPGGRSAAPTREQDDERPDDSVRRTSLGAQRLVAAIDAHVAKTHEPLAAGKDPAVAAQLFSEDSIELLLKAREVVALLSRSAEPPEVDREQQLLAQIEERRGDEAFMRRLRARIYQDWPLLDQLGGVAAEPKEHGDGR